MSVVLTGSEFCSGAFSENLFFEYDFDYSETIFVITISTVTRCRFDRDSDDPSRRLPV